MKLKNLFSKKDMWNPEDRRSSGEPHRGWTDHHTRNGKGHQRPAGSLHCGTGSRLCSDQKISPDSQYTRLSTFSPADKYYKHAESTARKIVTDLKYAVVTGGGPGIMEAANKGAYEAKGVSLGFNIRLPKEQKTNPYVTASVDFQYFFDRQTIMFFAAEAYVYYPGGFGTFDELFSLVTSIQTKKIGPAPVILVGSEFWMPFMKVIKQKLFVENNTIGEEDMNIYTVVDTEDEIIDIIRKAPYRQE